MLCAELWAKTFLNRLNHVIRRPLAQSNVCLLTNMPQYRSSSNAVLVENNVKK